MSKPVRPRNAASLVIYRHGDGRAEVVMGRRHQTARFKPGVYVFPGGMVERSDAGARPGTALDPAFTTALAVAGSHHRARALAMAAIRETYEEAGLLVAEPGDVGPSTNPTWRQLRERQVAPALGHLGYLGRAITPSTRPMRFHARFFCVDAKYIRGEFASNGELEDLRWVAIEEHDSLPVMNVTRTILKALARRLAGFAEPPVFLGGFRKDG